MRSTAAFAGGVFGQTPLEFVPTIDVLGVYPTVETLGAQAAERGGLTKFFLDTR